MAIDTIGRVADAGVDLQQSNVDLEDFLQIFLAQLNFQDPLEPVDNREFLAQLAQFSSLETSNRTNETMDALLDVTGIEQSVGLVGREVQVAGVGQGSLVGTVTALSVDGNGNPSLTILTPDNQSLVGISPAQVSLVR